MTARNKSAPAWSPSWPSPRTARPALWSASPAISPRATMRSIWGGSPPTRSAARAAAGGPTWRRPAARMAPRQVRRSRRSKRQWAAADAMDLKFASQRHRDGDAKNELLALDAQDFHALIERVPDLAAR